MLIVFILPALWPLAIRSRQLLPITAESLRHFPRVTILVVVEIRLKVGCEPIPLMSPFDSVAAGDAPPADLALKLISTDHLGFGGRHSLALDSGSAAGWGNPKGDGCV